MFAADLSPVDLSHEEERPATPSQVGHVLPEELNLLKAFSDARAMVNKVEEGAPSSFAFSTEIESLQAENKKLKQENASLESMLAKTLAILNEERNHGEGPAGTSTNTHRSDEDGMLSKIRKVVLGEPPKSEVSIDGGSNGSLQEPCDDDEVTSPGTSGGGSFFGFGFRKAAKKPTRGDSQIDKEPVRW